MSSPLLPSLVVMFAAFLAFAAGQSNLVQDGTTAGWPSLQFRFTIKRSAMEVHGESDFSVLANPIMSSLSDPSDNASVLYDTFTAFAEDDILYNYSLVDGVAYVSRGFLNGSSVNNPPVKCMGANILPPVNSIVAALSDAKPISTILTSNGSTIPCSSGNSFKTSVNGIDFGLCFSGSAGFTMYGSDMDITVEYVTKHMHIQAPTLSEDVKNTCEKVSSPSSVTSIGTSLLTGESIPSSATRELEAAFEFSLEESCSCQSMPRPCIFIHGLGVITEEKENLDSHAYWGNLTGHTPCCSSTKYAMLNTVNNSWTDDIQQQKVCDHVLEASDTSEGTTISDTIIITHSMGGLMLAGAIANERCSLASSATWVSTGAPMTGSMASNYFQESCKDETNRFMEKFVETTGYCPADDGIKSLAYQRESYSTAALDRAYTAAQKAYRQNVDAVMCSDAYSGILSSYQVGFWVLGSVVSHKSKKNDGMVEFHSCGGGFPASKFGNDYHDRFYRAKLNHYDVAFKAGDALLDKTKMPVKWFECLL
uniref:GPI inositol-deacylase n=1 Tax=Phytophthora ramorum TaxID=164328 RepID=H3GV78_PHYRM